jgi:hypothetical protein
MVILFFDRGSRKSAPMESARLKIRSESASMRVLEVIWSSVFATGSHLHPLHGGDTDNLFLQEVNETTFPVPGANQVDFGKIRFRFVYGE